MLTQIRLMRLLSGITARELSRRASIERSRLSRLETGHLRPRADEIQRIEQALAAGSGQGGTPGPVSGAAKVG